MFFTSARLITARLFTARLFTATLVTSILCTPIKHERQNRSSHIICNSTVSIATMTDLTKKETLDVVDKLWDMRIPIGCHIEALNKLYDTELCYQTLHFSGVQLVSSQKRYASISDIVYSATEF
jgi:hypothetical protein